MRPTDMLKVLPDLAAEVWMTRNAPNPAGETNDRRGGGTVHRTPLDLTAWDALRPDPHGQLAKLSMCVQIIAEELRDAGQPWPRLNNPPTWVAECDWLLATADWWQQQPWRDDITHEITHVWRELTRAARTPPPLQLTCPRCHSTVHGKADVKGGQPAYYECTEGHILDHAAELRRMGELQEMTTGEIADHLGCSTRWVRKMKAAKALTPVGRRGQEDVWLVSDVRMVQERTRKVRA